MFKTFAAGNFIDHIGGATYIKLQDAFPVVLTSTWDTTTGYSWSRLAPSRTSSALSMSTPDAEGYLANTDQYALPIDGNTTLPIGTKGLIVLSADRLCYLFIPGPAFSGTGASTTTSGTPTTNGSDSSLIAQYAVDPSTATDPTTVPVAQYQVANNIDGTFAGMLTSYYPSGTGAAVGATPVTTPVVQYQITPSTATTTFDYGGSTAGWTADNGGINTRIRYTGDIDFSSATVTGITTGVRTEGTLAAAGTTQGTAAAITTDAVEVTGADGTKGVILLNNTAEICVVWNSDAASALKVYPPSGATIGSTGTNLPLTIIAKGIGIFLRISSTQWTELTGLGS